MRRYHGLLVAALKPPLARTLRVAKVDDQIDYAGVTHPLFTNRWSDNTVDREDFRSRLERLRAMATTHETELAEWSRRVGRPLRVPRIAFPWPPAPLWDALLASQVEGPTLLWADDSTGRGA
jgi:hypothetical protein